MFLRDGVHHVMEFSRTSPRQWIIPYRGRGTSRYRARANRDLWVYKFVPYGCVYGEKLATFTGFRFSVGVALGTDFMLLK